MQKIRVALIVFFCLVLTLSIYAWYSTSRIQSLFISIPAFTEQEHLPGGEMTAKRLSERTFIHAGRNVQGQEKLSFWTGFSLFRDPWVIAPSSTSDRDGLGPLFNTRSCISCHLAGARGHAPIIGVSKPSALVIRLGPKQSGSGLWADKNYGDQIQPRAIPIEHHSLSKKLQGEAKLDLEYTELVGAYADGASYSLREPMYKLVELSQGDIQENIGMSPRFAPVIYGLGLIEAISQQDLLSQEDIDDDNNDGISAKYNRVFNTGSHSEMNAIGRFGLKAKHSSLRRQIGAAFRDDIGITNAMFEFETCSHSQQDCVQASVLGEQASVELPDKLLDLVAVFTRSLAVPPARNLEAKEAQEGRRIFYEAQCASCHTPHYVTSTDYPVKTLSGQSIYPYSNFALHDMGEALADTVHEFSANGREWRTPPLWGLGLQQRYNKNAVFLHDGRARNIEEAILWHGGEAKQSQELFINMSLSERNALLTFLKAI